MKRKYGSARSRETVAEQRMREAAKASGDNSHNYGSISRKGSPRAGRSAPAKLASESWQSGRMRRS